MKVFKKDTRTFMLNETFVLEIIDVINDTGMNDVFNLSVVRSGDKGYRLSFVTDDDVWNDILSEFDKANFELVLKPNQVMYLRKKA